jgi:quercetin dioxygenase-like cupin family protein/tetratricopeptide (TPR) repeat protein
MMNSMRRDWKWPGQLVARGIVPLLLVSSAGGLLVQASTAHAQNIIGLGEQRVLRVLGESITVKIGGEQTGGRYAVVENVSPVGGGPPLHIHRDEDELLYVVGGEMELQLGDQRVRAKAGSTAFLPRDVPHTFRNVGTSPSKVLVVITPARFVGFFEEVDALAKPTPEQAMELGKKYGLTFLPPPKGKMLGAGVHGEHVAPKGAPPEKLGEVSFPVSCNEAAQKEFNRGMALFHSFWFDPAKQSFAKVLEHDPECGMAHWGIAIMSMGNPFTWPTNPAASKAGAPSAAQARRVGGKTEREREYIAALGTLFKDWETTEFRPRALAFEQAMQRVAAKYPQDDEAQILYALALNVTALPTDKAFTNQLKAAAILEPLFKKHPDHPGVAHYLIHTYDYAELAEKGLPAARSYGGIAPSVPHALHMPSHIFSRVGLWREMVEANRASYLAAKGELKEETLGIGAYDALHAMDYMVFGQLQQAQDKAAKQLVDEAGAIQKVNVENFVAAYAFAAIPSRYALERGDWKRAAALRLSPADLAWNKFPQSEAILVFARGLGAARSGDVAAARRDLERLHALKESLTAAKSGYWAGQTDFQIKTLNAWIALAETRHAEAVQMMRAAAEAEEASDKHPVTPGNVVPSRELLGEMLMALNQPAQALAEFERSLKRDPSRFRGIYGAARAAEASGNREKARDYYAKLQTLAAERDTERPELAHAGGFLGMR